MSYKLPLIRQLSNYTIPDGKQDLLAGLTVAIILIPQGMAYAMLAGLPAIYGLYAGLVPLLIYPLFGSSRSLSVGPVALVSILVLTGLSGFAEPESTRYIQLAILTAFVAGLIQLGLSFFKMGFIINFLSYPVILGFTAAAAFIIAISQLKYIIGVALPPQTAIIDTVLGLFEHILDLNLYTLIIGVGGIFIIFLFKKLKPSFPIALLVTALGISVVYLFNWQEKGVEIVGQVPAGLPMFEMPGINLSDILSVLPLALIICLISFIESLAIAKSIASKHKNYKINADQELLALGAAKIAGSFFQAFPNTGSFTRSAINDQAGSKTGLSSIFAAVFVSITLLFLTDFFYFLPKAILASIIVVAVFSLIHLDEIIYIFKNDKSDFWVFLVTFLLTIFLGIQAGVFTGIILSILFILYKTSQPNYAVLGRLPETNTFRDINRYSEANEIDHLLLFRFDASLYFGNAEFFYEKLNKEIQIKLPGLEVVVLDSSSILDIDITGMEQLKLIIDELKDADIRFVLAGTLGPVRDILEKSGIANTVGKNNHFIHIKDAVQVLTEDTEVSRKRRSYATQYNLKKKNTK